MKDPNSQGDQADRLEEIFAMVKPTRNGYLPEYTDEQQWQEEVQGEKDRDVIREFTEEESPKVINILWQRLSNSSPVSTSSLLWHTGHCISQAVSCGRILARGM